MRILLLKDCIFASKLVVCLSSITPTPPTTQVVKIGQELSEPFPITCGVPQGSILGPVLFLMYFNDFEGSLNNTKVIQFVDDTVVYVSSKSIDDIERKLNEDMCSIYSYLETTDLIINLKKGKSECILFGTSKRISTIPPDRRELKVFCNGEQINVTTSYKYLGTLLDQNLGLSADFEQKYKKASSKLGLLRKLIQYLTLDAAKLLYSSVIVSHRFNGIVHLNLNQSQLAKLKSLERRADALLERLF